MALSIFYIVISVVLLVAGANLLVQGSAQIARKAGLSPLVIGLTVVAFGTSFPELAASVNASLAGQGGIAVGNVIGSNIFNICVILGITALVSPMRIKLALIRYDLPILLVSTLVFMILFHDRVINRIEGLALVILIAGYTLFAILMARREKNREVIAEFDDSLPKKEMKWYMATGYLLAGLGMLAGASRLLIHGAVDVAGSLGVGQTVIGLTIIAAGTSMPELAASVVAAIRKEPDIAVGNIIGSNIFNILGITGISALSRPLSAMAISNIDIYAMIGVTLLLLPFFRTNYKLKRDEGIFLLLLYGVYFYYLWPK